MPVKSGKYAELSLCISFQKKETNFPMFFYILTEKLWAPSFSLISSCILIEICSGKSHNTCKVLMHVSSQPWKTPGRVKTPRFSLPVSPLED